MNSLYDFYDWVLKSSRTPQSVESILSRAAQNRGGEEVWDGTFKFVSKMSTYIGTGTTAAGTAISFFPGGQPLGGLFIAGGEGLVKIGTGVAVFNDFRKGNYGNAAINVVFYGAGRAVGSRLGKAKSLGFGTPFKQQEINLINGLNQSVFNTANITVNKALIEN